MSRVSLKDLVSASLKVGVTGFGGGSALIPVIEREYVQQRKLLDESTFTAHVIVSNVTPGALPVKLAALAGSRTRSIFGSLFAAIAMAFPAAFATVVLLALFSVIGSGAIRLVEFAAVGITVFIAVLLIEYIYKVLRSQKLVLAVAIMLLAYAVTGFNQTSKVLASLTQLNFSTNLPQLNAVALIVCAVVAVAVVAAVARGKRAASVLTPIQTGRVIPQGVVFAAVTAIVLAVGAVFGGGKFLSLIGLSTVTSFGGGEAYVGVVDGFFLSSGIVDPMHFYGQALPIANALLFGVLAFLISVTACCALVMFLMAAYDKAANSAFVQYLGVVILPVICGLLLSTMMAMLNASMEIAKNADVSVPAVGWISIGGVVAAWFAHKRLPDLVLLALTGAVSLIAMLIATA